MFKSEESSEAVSKKTTFGRSSGIEFIRNEMDWDKHDVWGSVLAARFDLAGAWFLATGETIQEFRPSPHFDLLSLGFGRGSRFLGAMKDGIITADDVYYWDRVLDQARDLVIKAGRDY
jgi:hypothetical protein